LGVSYTSDVAGIEQYYYNGFIFDVLIYSRALGIAELTVVENFLSNKWGIPVGCPTPTPTPTTTVTPTPSITPSGNIAPPEGINTVFVYFPVKD